MSTLRDLLDRVRNARVEAEACYCHDDLVCQLCGAVMGAEGDLCTWLLDHPEAVEAVESIATFRTRLAAAEAERDRYRSALRDVAREWPYLDLIDPQTAQGCDLRGLVEYLLGALRSEQRVAREALEGHTDA